VDNSQHGNNEDIKCPDCGKEMTPLDEYGTKGCDCESLAKALNKLMHTN
jgi:hypothetical protein